MRVEYGLPAVQHGAVPQGYYSGYMELLKVLNMCGTLPHNRGSSQFPPLYCERTQRFSAPSPLPPPGCGSEHDREITVTVGVDKTEGVITRRERKRTDVIDVDCDMSRSADTGDIGRRYSESQNGKLSLVYEVDFFSCRKSPLGPAGPAILYDTRCRGL